MPNSIENCGRAKYMYPDYYYDDDDDDVIDCSISRGTLSVLFSLKTGAMCGGGMMTWAETLTATHNQSVKSSCAYFFCFVLFCFRSFGRSECVQHTTPVSRIATVHANVDVFVWRQQRDFLPLFLQLTKTRRRRLLRKCAAWRKEEIRLTALLFLL